MICFPDINVWIALIVAEHIHHPGATDWYSRTEGNTLVFSRITQMGFLRLLTNEHVVQRVSDMLASACETLKREALDAFDDEQQLDLWRRWVRRWLRSLRALRMSALTRCG